MFPKKKTSFKGVIHAGFKDDPKAGSIGLEWSSDRRHATFQVGMELVISSYLRHDKSGRGRVDVDIIGNDGRRVVCTAEMRVVSGVFSNADKGRRMIILSVE